MSTFDRSSWSDRERPEGSLSVAEALRGLPVTPRKRMDEVHLATVVAATLRAAAEVLMGPESAWRALSVAWDDGALDVLVPMPASGDVVAAASLLQTIDGSLGNAERERAWMMRVPVLGPRTLYLMVEQGTLGLAVPWHAVIRVRMSSRPSLDAVARRAGHAVLAPLVQVPSDSVERPAVLLGHGLRRAYLPADKLVWRMPAELVESEGTAPDPELARAVRTEDGEVYWIADPARLLRGIAPPPLPDLVHRTPAPAAPPEEPAAEVRETLKPGGSREPEAAKSAQPDEPESGAPARSAPRLVELRREDVTPLEETADPAEPKAAKEEATQPPVPEAPAAPRATRRVLVAEDSIVGRVFLQRLLELRGFEVESVATARELLATLPFGPWVLVFADVDLPDSPRGSHLKGLSHMAPGSIMIALVRDAEDRAVAAASGIARVLRKPFEQAPLQRLLHELGLESARR